VFWRQFDTVAEYNCWTRLEKYIHFITVLQDRATDVLHGVPIGAIYKETLETWENLFVNQHLAAAYRSQLKIRTQGVRVSLQEFTTAVEEHPHRAYPAV
jgi:hypothetical protein